MHDSRVRVLGSRPSGDGSRVRVSPAAASERIREAMAWRAFVHRGCWACGVEGDLHHVAGGPGVWWRVVCGSCGVVAAEVVPWVGNERGWWVVLFVA